ncbi:MAG: GGDEF domain-containing protein [Pseudazoarcus pumilus]|nr:GGDEF domain-containing protein [Pseudazoarcus pumilus]
MSEFLPLILSLLTGVAVGIAVARLRGRRPQQVMPQTISTSPSDDDHLAAQLAARTHELESLRARLAALERVEKSLTLSDPLTGIANRTLLTERIDHAITRGQRHNTRLGVVMLQLKDFAALRKRLGEQAADRLLIAAARRLREAVRAEDTVSHLQGDRFAIALEGVFEREDIERAHEAILRAFAEPFEADDQPVALEAEISSALFPADGSDADSLLRAAEHGLSHAGKPRRRTRGKSTAESKQSV